jgi:hypothetical protein
MKWSEIRRCPGLFVDKRDFAFSTMIEIRALEKDLITFAGITSDRNDTADVT